MNLVKVHSYIRIFFILFALQEEGKKTNTMEDNTSAWCTELFNVHWTILQNHMTMCLNQKSLKSYQLEYRNFYWYGA